MTMGITSPTSTTGQILKDGTPVISFDANNNATFAGTVVSNTPLGMRNRIINGDMRIDQRNAGASVSATTTSWSVDRWQAYASQTSKYTIQQSSTVPTGFSNAILVTSSSAYSVTSTDIFFLRQIIEGYNIADLGFGTANAKSITLSFWVRSSLTGTFGGALTNDSNRAYPFTYTISSANTWEQKTVTLTADTSGTWGSTNNAGLAVIFSLGAGSTRIGTAGAWTGTNYYGATGETSVVGTNGATFYITGVQLEVGSTATPFERRLFNQELANCQRYFEKSCNYSSAPGSVSFESILKYAEGTSNYITITWNFRVSKRASPTIVAYSPNTGTSGKMRINSGDINAAVDWFTENSASIYANNVSVATNDAARVYATASAEL